jgi:hypothetical protein
MEHATPEIVARQLVTPTWPMQDDLLGIGGQFESPRAERRAN